MYRKKNLIVFNYMTLFTSTFFVHVGGRGYRRSFCPRGSLISLGSSCLIASAMVSQCSSHIVRSTSLALGKDRSIFVTKEDANQPAVVSSLVEEDEAYGIVKPDGSINWECPCLGEKTLVDAVYLRVVQCRLCVCVSLVRPSPLC